MKRFLKLFFKIAKVGVIALLLVILGSYYFIKHQVADLHTKDLSLISPQKTALVLGTSKRVIGGGQNLFFNYRMQAVRDLFAAKKIRYVIVSGDNAQMEYNETRDMKRALIKLGIPEENIVMDFAGFRTLDSVVRAKEVFGQDSIIIVSQPFHNERALFIAKKHGIHATGYDAKTVSARYSFKTYAREYLARVKCMLDIYLLGTMPKFYKDKETFPSE